MPIFHAAVLPLALWGGAVARRRSRPVARLATGWAVAAVMVALFLAAGGRRHRCGGESSIVIPLVSDHPMLHDLRILDSCPFEIRPDGWWPDVLPRQPPSRGGRAG